MFLNGTSHLPAQTLPVSDNAEMQIVVTKVNY